MYNIEILAGAGICDYRATNLGLPGFFFLGTSVYVAESLEGKIGKKRQLTLSEIQQKIIPQIFEKKDLPKSPKSVRICGRSEVFLPGLPTIFRSTKQETS